MAAPDPFSMLPGGLADSTDEQFLAFTERLRQELAPSGPLEMFLADQILVHLARLRRAAQWTPPDPLDPNWLRYQNMAERGFWRAWEGFHKNRQPKPAPRKPKSKAAPAPAPPPPPPAPAPEPAPPPAPASRPEPIVHLPPSARGEPSWN